MTTGSSRVGRDAEPGELVDGHHQAAEPGHRRGSDHHDQIGPAQRRAGQQVAVLDVDRADLVVALDVRVDVGHHLAERPLQAVERGLDRSGPQGGPVTVAAQAEQQVVARALDVEGEPAHLVDRRRAVAVGLGQLLHAGHDVAGVVQQGLVGVQGARSASSTMPASLAGRGQSLGQRHGHRRRSAAGRSGDRDEAAAPARRCRREGGPGLDLGAADGLGRLGQRGQDERSVELGGQHGVDPEGGPVAAGVAVVDHQHRGPGLPGGVDEVTVEAGQPGVDETAENARPDRSRACSSSTATHFTNSTGNAALVAHRLTSRNQGERGWASPSTR